MNFFEWFDKRYLCKYCIGYKQRAEARQRAAANINNVARHILSPDKRNAHMRYTRGFIPYVGVDFHALIKQAFVYWASKEHIEYLNDLYDQWWAEFLRGPGGKSLAINSEHSFKKYRDNPVLLWYKMQSYGGAAPHVIEFVRFLQKKLRG